MLAQKPNIFKLATKELSQDSFFAWLLLWGDQSYSVQNSELNDTSRDFIRLLVNETPNYPIRSVKAGRQWHNIDIWAEINENVFLCIEDKTNSNEHSGQLERYKKLVEEEYKSKDHKLVFIYLKTGNESKSTIDKIREKGYFTIDRKSILEVLKRRKINNEIFNDFIDYLDTIEHSTNSYVKFQTLISDWKAAEGFYLKLQELIPEWSEWRYVSNKAGGFLGFWYHWSGTPEYSLYIQIENLIDYGTIRLVIKISDWNPSLNTLYRVLSDLKPFTSRYNLSIQKPEKFRIGETSTLAIVSNPFLVDDHGNLDINDFIVTLINLQSALDEHSAAYSI